MAYLESVLLGISFAAIPGPIFFEVIRRTLTRGFLSGSSVFIGEFFANFVLLILAFFGFSQFLLFSPIKMMIFLLGGIVLVLIGISALKIREKTLENLSEVGVSKSNSFFIGVTLAITSPITIAFWISIAGTYLIQYASKLVAFINIVLLALGTVLFMLVLATIVHQTKHKIPSEYLIWLSRIFGVILIGYGITFFYKFIRVVFDF